MYEINFSRQATSGQWIEDIYLEAADDGCPLSNVNVRIQMWSHTGRGAGDQSQRYGWSQFGMGTPVLGVPVFDVSTDDNTGRLFFIEPGWLRLNIDFPSMCPFLLPGYYEMGGTLFDDYNKISLFVGTVPIINGGVFR